MTNQTVTRMPDAEPGQFLERKHKQKSLVKTTGLFLKYEG